jgi:hypothetical protein
MTTITKLPTAPVNPLIGDLTALQVQVAGSSNRVVLGRVTTPGLAIVPCQRSEQAGRYAVAHIPTGRYLWQMLCGYHALDGARHAAASAVDWTAELEALRDHRQTMGVLGLLRGACPQRCVGDGLAWSTTPGLAEAAETCWTLPTCDTAPDEAAHYTAEIAHRIADGGPQPVRAPPSQPRSDTPAGRPPPPAA